MTTTTEGSNKAKIPVLSPNKWLLILLLFVIGILLLVESNEIENNKMLANILEMLGSFLVIAIPIEILDKIFFEEATKDSFARQVSQIFDEKIDAELIQARKFGLERIENKLPIEEMFDKLQPGDTLWWLDTFCPGHMRWIDHVKRAVRRGASVNMLILDPKSSFCTMRSQEISHFYSESSFTTELKAFVTDFERCQKDLGEISDRLNVLLYNDLLGVPCYVVTRSNDPIYAYSSMYLTQPTGIDFPHFYWTKGPMCEYLFHYIKGKYDTIRAKSEP